MERGLSFLVGLAAIVGIVAGGIYIHKNTHDTKVGCTDLIFWTNCGVTVPKN